MGLQNTSHLTVFNFDHNSLSEEAADHIASILSHNTKLQKLYLGRALNNLQARGAVTTTKDMQNN